MKGKNIQSVHIFSVMDIAQFQHNNINRPFLSWYEIPVLLWSPSIGVIFSYKRWETKQNLPMLPLHNKVIYIHWGNIIAFIPLYLFILRAKLMVFKLYVWESEVHISVIQL